MQTDRQLIERVIASGGAISPTFADTYKSVPEGEGYRRFKEKNPSPEEAEEEEEGEYDDEGEDEEAEDAEEEEEEEEDLLALDGEAEAEEEEEDTGLPPGWAAAVDPGSGDTYYYPLDGSVDPVWSYGFSNSELERIFF